MLNHNLTDLSVFIAGAHNGTGSHEDYDYDYYGHGSSPNDTRGTDYDIYNSYRKGLYTLFIVLFCICGMLGNGMVIWLLGFRIERNHFTIYVLNLAIADFGVLTAAVMFQIMIKQIDEYYFFVILHMYSVLFSTSQHLLTVISMDRCISVFFPIWHRCHRPTYLSTIVCALIWLLSLLSYAISYILLEVFEHIFMEAIKYLFIVNVYVPLPLMTISSLMLFIKLCCKRKQQKRPKLLTTILVTVFFFLFVCIPLHAIYMKLELYDDDLLLLNSVFIFACLNSSVNPYIYYLIGMPKKGRSNKGMKAVLQKLFKEEEIGAQGVHRPAAVPTTSNQQRDGDL